MSRDSIKPGTLPGTAYLLAHALRVLLHAHRSAIGDRWRHLSTEIVSLLPQLAATSASSVEFFGACCERLALQPIFPRSGRPLAISLHLDVVGAYGFAHGTEFEEGEQLGPGFFSVSWFDVMGTCPIEQVRTLLRRGAPFFASVAMQYVEAGPAREAFLTDYRLFEWTGAQERRFVPSDLSRAFAPVRVHVLITLLSPLAHGGDSSGTNVTSFRREDRVDAFTGEVVSMPFVSGAAVRGLCRDLLMLDYLERVGVPSREVRPDLAHALLSGGSIDAGAAMGVVDNVFRQKVRAVCPPIDLFGGVVDAQFMTGQLLVGDAVPVCKQAAWLVAPALGWSIDEAKERAAELPDADALMLDRMGTRRHHEEIDGKSQQMIYRTQAIGAGHQLACSFGLRAGPAATPMQVATLGHMLVLLASAGTLGAKAQAGFGQVALEIPENLVEASKHYADHIGRLDHEEIGRWLRGHCPLTPPPEKPEGGGDEKAKARGKGRGKKEQAGEPVAG